MELIEIEKQAADAARELCAAAKVPAGGIVVVGCSSSEVGGGVIGHNSSPEIAAAVYRGLSSVLAENGLYLAAQCCEHLNRAIVVERAAVAAALAVAPLGFAGYHEVNAVPQPKAGGSFGTCAYRSMTDPVVLDGIAADAGLDIGGTLIGMHLRRVAVPVRLPTRQIGFASVTAARVRLPFTGGARAVYDEGKL
ncbi:MAG: TIGR01440 family protein [Eubacteriales bacterium]